ncbi:MAG: glycerate kinase [Oscillospiraceae bacterium]|jgi:glycerate kinase|nr:glycerate kinase [Oscillospiraceae bacterium]
MKIILAPDSFKGTLTATEVCGILADEFAVSFPAAEICLLPLADGGEGLAAAVHRLRGGRWLEAAVAGPWGKPVQAAFLLLPDGTAVLETASCAGLELARGAPEGLNPARTTTQGLGELLLAARASGAARILLGLGGSATNDGGCGMADALGWRFLRADDTGFLPTGATLTEIARILPPDEPYGLPVTAACDVTSPLFGPDGAAHVYAPQKGADPAMVLLLDTGLQHLAAVCGEQALAWEPGAGAAGGLGFGVRRFLGGELRPGIDLLLDMADFDALVRGNALVVTGEGRMDAQTLQGKAPCGVLRRAQRRGVPVIAVCGCAEEPDALLAAGFSAIFPASGGGQALEVLQRHCREELRQAARQAADWIVRTTRTHHEGSASNDILISERMEST